MGEAKRRKALKPDLKTPIFPLFHYTIGRRLPFIKDKGLLPAEPHHSRFVWLTESRILDPTSCAAMTLNGPFYNGDLNEFDRHVGGAFRLEVNPTAIRGLKHFSDAPEVRYIKAKNNHGANPDQWWICREVKPTGFVGLEKLTPNGWIKIDWKDADLPRLAQLPRLRFMSAGELKTKPLNCA